MKERKRSRRTQNKRKRRRVLGPNLGHHGGGVESQASQGRRGPMAGARKARDFWAPLGESLSPRVGLLGVAHDPGLWLVRRSLSFLFALEYNLQYFLPTLKPMQNSDTSSQMETRKKEKGNGRKGGVSDAKKRSRGAEKYQGSWCHPGPRPQYIYIARKGGRVESEEGDRREYNTEIIQPGRVQRTSQ